MISDIVKQELEQFADVWGVGLESFPNYRLDGRWPTLGVIDYMTEPLRQRTKFYPFEQDIIRYSACYVGEMLHRIWAEAGIESRVEDSSQGIRISLGAAVESARTTPLHVKLQLELSRQLAALPFSVGSHHDHPVLVPGFRQLVPRWVMSIALGESASIEGALDSAARAQLGERRGAVLNSIAKQCAEWFARVAPDDTLTQLPELYSALLYSPGSPREEWPVLSGIDRLLAFQAEYEIPARQMNELAIRLACCPEELLSHIGFAYAVAVCPGPLSSELLSIGHSKGTYGALLRYASQRVRERLGLPDDWIDATEARVDDLSRVSVEIEAGLFPWLAISPKRLLDVGRDEQLRQLLKACRSFDIGAAVAAADALVEQDPQDIDYAAQRIFLKLVVQDTEGAKIELERIRKLSIRGIHARCENLAGVIAVGDGDYYASERCFADARVAAASEPSLFAEIANSCGWAQVCQGRVREALISFEDALQSSPGHLLAEINRIGCLLKLQEATEAEGHLERLLRSGPADRSVFLGLAQGLVARIYADQIAVEEEEPLSRAA